MAASDFCTSMLDPKLRPRLLRSITRDLSISTNRAKDLSSILNYIKIHRLLEESNLSHKDHRKAVDEWVEKLLSLVDGNSPDKCWGICLLGVACEECNDERFLSSYSLWFQKLLPNIQPPSSTHFIKTASCASLADLFTRLSGFPKLKKDATSLAGKLIQPVLLLFSEDGTEALWEGAIDLLCTLLTLFPSSMHRHYDNVEAVLASKICSAKCNANMSKNFARCLALLPKVRSDENSWSLLMQKILIAINMFLNDAFQGLEREAISYEIMRLLVPPGKEPPPPLGGQSISGEESGQATKRLRETLVPRVSTLMHCCCMMLTNPYPVQVTVPIPLLLATARRVLHMDGSLHGSLLPFTTTMHQEILCADLPVLHLDSLDLLIAIIKAVRSQLLPHAANVVRLLTEYFRKATLASIRIKCYSILETLLISMGVGMVLYLAQEVINNSFADLNSCAGSGGMSLKMCSPKGVSEVLPQSSHKKRKHSSGSLMGRSNGVDLEVETLSRKPSTPLSVKIAALRALRALLTVGGSLTSECWRSDVDLLLINVATNACDAGWAPEGRCPILTEETSNSRADFQLAALEALLASLLSASPTHGRHPYLSRGLELFSRGKQETGTKLAAFCAHALLVIHSRSLPLVVGSPVVNTITVDEHSSRFQEPSMPSLSKGVLGAIDDINDDVLFYSWLRNNDEELAVKGNNIDKNPEETAEDGNKINKHTEPEQSLRASMEEMSVDKVAVANQVQGHEVVQGNHEAVQNADVEMEEHIEIIEVPNGSSKGADVISSSSIDFTKNIDTSKIDTSKNSSPAELFPSTTEGKASAELTQGRKDGNDGFMALTNGSFFKTDVDKVTMPSYDSDSSSIGSLPDIVDVPPDSDSDTD